MSTIIRKTTTGYEMEKDGVVTHKNLKVVFDKRKGCGDIVLPENDFARKWLSESRFGDLTEIDLANIPPRQSTGTTSTSTPRPKAQTWEDFLTDEEKEAIADIKKAAEARMARKLLEDQIEAQKKILEELMKKLEA